MKKTSFSKNGLFKIIRSYAEYMAFTFFFLLYLIIAAFHEPWFDEAQAWQIARYSSIKEILTIVGHYEGHPFLWYFILAIPAKIGIPFELGLKVIGLTISSISSFLCIFKAPFSKIVRCGIPFTNFFFYKYGIIVRPYCLMILLFILCAISFKERNQHPWKFVLPMIALCTLSAYGIVLCGGICLCWLSEIFIEYRYSFRIDLVSKDRRFFPLLILLSIALITIGLIIPYSDTYSGASDATHSKIVCFGVAIATFLADAFMTSSPFLDIDTKILQSADFNFMVIAAEALISFVLFALFICYSSRKKISYFILPVLMFTAFGGFVYFSGHHIGVLAVYLMFWCWINAEDSNRFEIGRYLFTKLKGSEKDEKLYRCIGFGLITVCFLVNFYWSIGSSVLDLKYQYSFGRETAAFLKENKLDKLKLAASWIEYPLTEGEKRGPENINTVVGGIPPLVDAYFDQNIIYTFYNGEDIGYMEYKKNDPFINEKNLEAARTVGIPDVLVGKVDVELLTEGKRTLDDYAPVFKMETNYIYKASCDHASQYLYVRRDLMDDYNLTELEVPKTSVEITDEMRERYKNGEPMEDIINPILDEMFPEN